MAPYLSFGKSKGRQPWIGMRKREGPTLFLALAWKDRERGYAPSLVHENLKGASSVGAHLPALYCKGRPIRLTYLTEAPHILVKRD